VITGTSLVPFFALLRYHPISEEKGAL